MVGVPADIGILLNSGLQKRYLLACVLLARAYADSDAKDEIRSFFKDHHTHGATGASLAAMLDAPLSRAAAIVLLQEELDEADRKLEALGQRLLAQYEC